jgi:hypothetical protein
MKGIYVINDNAWENWANHVLLELERLNENIKETNLRVDACKDLIVQNNLKMNLEIQAIRIKASIFGLIAGFIPVLIGIIMNIYQVFFK